MNIEKLTELLYDQAVDGEFTKSQSVLKLLEKLTKSEQELLMACYWIGWNDYSEVENDPT